MPRCSTDVAVGAGPFRRTSDLPELATGGPFLFGELRADKVRMKPVWDLTTPNGGRESSTRRSAKLLHLIALSSASRIAQGDQNGPVEATSLADVRITKRPAVKTAEQEPGECARSGRFF